MAQQHGIRLKKKHGQYFLRDQQIVQAMINHCLLTSTASVFEIGCGDGFLTRAIMSTPVARLWVFEIDAEWATFVRNNIIDPRLTVIQEDFLKVDWQVLAAHQPWTVLANLPYHITFPILHSFVAHRQLLTGGVLMVQEEVAQKIVKQAGRGYGYISLYFQHYFEWELLKKVPPTAFEPMPKVHSRLLAFTPRAVVEPIEREAEFWRFIKYAFAYPRRTLKNNLKQTHLPLARLDEQTLLLRAQQLRMSDFLAMWKALIAAQ